MSEHTLLEKTNQMNMLYDFYGGLLTERQQSFVEMYYLEDLSLSEIAEQTGVSRQAVHDHLRRSAIQLIAFENKLHLIDRHVRKRNQFIELIGWVHELSLPEQIKEALIARISDLVQEGEKEELACLKD